ncbi:MAG: bifunctional glutamate N-acetyltransferase/amino-acid acetyltransferase ArgJ [Phycisphaeraceae bacterium]|nr:bifunctional glutamate N-acetyltransferase/amino-acid acetyltransferase ArgJ [Phycisphaeraceae bacterium]
MSITQPLGFRAAGATAGLKPSGKSDLALIVRDGPDDLAASAAVFTANAVVGAPVVVGRRLRAAWLAGRPAARAVLVNAGNSNAATGAAGIRDAEACADAVAQRIGAPPGSVIPSSTGIIGRPLPVDRIRAALPALAGALTRGPDADAAAAQAIMTTDLVPKSASRQVTLGGARISLGAIAKGSGMIAPRLQCDARPPAPSATMLAFITTDARLSNPDLHAALARAAARSFNRISVDNHPSCSDTVICLASGQAGPRLAAGSAELAAFEAVLADLCRDLSEQIVADGEGATRVFRVLVRGADDELSAERIAREVVNSPLVKCAIHGRDANWGRIVTAAGNAGISFNPDLASLRIGPVEVYRQGLPIVEALGDPRLAQAMNAPRVECALTVGRGPGEAWMLGCDLSARYVSINADYTT